VGDKNRTLGSRDRIDDVNRWDETPIIQELAGARDSLDEAVRGSDVLGSVGLVDQEVARLDVAHGSSIPCREETLHKKSG